MFAKLLQKNVRTYQRRTCAPDQKMSFAEVNFANSPKLRKICENVWCQL